VANVRLQDLGPHSIEISLTDNVTKTLSYHEWDYELVAAPLFGVVIIPEVEVYEPLRSTSLSFPTQITSTLQSGSTNRMLASLSKSLFPTRRSPRKPSTRASTLGRKISLARKISKKASK